MGQYADAVELALKHGNVELASVVADMAGDVQGQAEDSGLRKKLWLKVAETVVKKEGSIKRYGAIFIILLFPFPTFPNPGYYPCSALPRGFVHAGAFVLGHRFLLIFTCQFLTHFTFKQRSRIS